MAEGLSSAGLRQRRGAAAQHGGDTGVPGLVAPVARGARVHVEALGTRAVGGRAVTGDSILRIASTTKLAVTVLAQRIFETPEAPQVHPDIRAAAYAALA